MGNALKHFWSDRKAVNKLWVVCLATLMGASVSLCSESYVQAYMLRGGLESSVVGGYGFAVQLFSLLAYLACISYSPLNKGMRIRYIGGIVLICLFPLCLILASAVQAGMLFFAALVIAAGSIYGILISYKAVVDCSIVPFLYDQNDFGVVTGVSGVSSGLVSIAVVWLAGDLMAQRGFPDGYYVVFSLAVLGFLVAAGVATRYSFKTPPGYHAPQKRESYLEVVRRMISPAYLEMMLPHFLRGVGTAGIYFFMTVSMQRIQLSDAYIGYSVSIITATTMLGNLCFTLLTKRVASGKITLAATILCSISIVVAALNKSPLLFLVLSGTYNFSNILSQISILTGVMRNTAAEELAAITVMRMLMYTGATSVFSIVFGALLQYIPAIWVMGTAAAAFTICGILFAQQHTDVQVVKASVKETPNT